MAIVQSRPSFGHALSLCGVKLPIGFVHYTHIHMGARIPVLLSKCSAAYLDGEVIYKCSQVKTKFRADCKLRFVLRKPGVENIRSI